MSVNFTFIELLLWRDSSALVIQCVLTLLPSLSHWVCCTPHRGTTLAACPTSSGALMVYFTVLPKTVHFFNEAVALSSLGLGEVCVPTQVPRQGSPLVHQVPLNTTKGCFMERALFPSAHQGKISLRFLGLGFAFYRGRI